MEEAQEAIQIANAFSWAWRNGADVISNSWYSEVESQVIDDAILEAMTKGRNGKGCVVVFSSGNDGHDTIGYPADFHPNVLTVGGIDYNGKRANEKKFDFGSDYGEVLDVMAPSVNIVTTTTNHKEGFYNYTMDFDGTSAACPHVSGLAALILSVNPDLTALMVNDIIETTARKVHTDLYTYSTVNGRPNGLWNKEMGYGLIDATAAVQFAEKCKFVSDKTITQSDTIEGYNIYLDKVSVTENAKLTILKKNNTLLKSNVYISNGSVLNIKNK